MHGAGLGYHNGFTIPAGSTTIQITEVPFNSIVYLGECIQYIEVKAHPIYTLYYVRMYIRSVWLPSAHLHSCDHWSSSTTEWWLEC